jgi:hypothetical protein
MYGTCISTYVDAEIACSVVEMHYCVFLRNSISCVRRGQIFNIPQSAHVLSCSHTPLKLTPIIVASLLPFCNPHCCPLTTLIGALLQLIGALLQPIADLLYPP